eukprot:945845_1
MKFVWKLLLGALGVVVLCGSEYGLLKLIEKPSDEKPSALTSETSKDATIRELNTTIAKNKVQAAAYVATIKKLNDKAAVDATSIQRMNTNLALKDATILARDTTIKKLNDKAAVDDAKIRAHDKTTGQLNNEAAVDDATILARDTTIKKLNDKAAVDATSIRDLETILALKGATILAQEKTIEKLNGVAAVDAQCKTVPNANLLTTTGHPTSSFVMEFIGIDARENCAGEKWCTVKCTKGYEATRTPWTDWTEYESNLKCRKFGVSLTSGRLPTCHKICDKMPISNDLPAG